MRICTVELLANERKVSLYRLMVFRWPYNCVLKNFRFAAIQTLSISSIYRERLTPGRHPTASHFEFSAANWTYRKKNFAFFHSPWMCWRMNLGKSYGKPQALQNAELQLKKFPSKKNFRFHSLYDQEAKKCIFHTLEFLFRPLKRW